MEAHISAVTGLKIWLQFFAADEYPDEIIPGNYRVQFFEPNDATCMVLSQQIGPNRELEYCFAAEDAAMSPLQARLIFAFLAARNYCLENLLAWLGQQVWISGIDGVKRIYVDGLLITKIGLEIGTGFTQKAGAAYQ